MSIPFQGYNRYVCPNCNNRFKFSNSLKVHIALKCDQLNINHLWTEVENEFNLTIRPHNTQSVAVPANDCPHAKQTKIIISNLGKSKQDYSCFHRGKVYTRKYGLKIHIRTHTGYKPLKCPCCSRSFGGPNNFAKHIRLHTDRSFHWKGRS